MDITTKDIIILFAGVIITIIATKLVDKYIPNWSKKRLEKKYQNKLATHNEINDVAESMDKINYYAGLCRMHKIDALLYLLLSLFFISIAFFASIELKERLIMQIIAIAFLFGNMLCSILYLSEFKTERYYKFVSEKAYELYRLNQKENGNTLSK